MQAAIPRLVTRASVVMQPLQQLPRILGERWVGPWQDEGHDRLKPVLLQHGKEAGTGFDRLKPVLLGGGILPTGQRAA